jgi:hypothetical protein
VFEIMTPENTQEITLNANWGLAPTEVWHIGPGTKAIGYAVLAYAKRHEIDPRNVGYSVRPCKN